LGITNPWQSKLNFSIFVVSKKTGKLRYVHDYCQLKRASFENIYLMKTVGKCIADIGHARSVVFSVMDCQNVFFQLLLDDGSSEYTMPLWDNFNSLGQARALSIAPSNLKGMMELAMIGLHHVIVEVIFLHVINANFKP
jgi:hypothetical protein